MLVDCIFAELCSRFRDGWLPVVIVNDSPAPDGNVWVKMVQHYLVDEYKSPSSLSRLILRGTVNAGTVRSKNPFVK